MSKPRYNWWPFALNMIKDYPARKRDFDDLHEQKVTASLTGMPGGGGTGRTLENIAARLLPHQEQREYDAVRKAVEYTKAMDDGMIRIKVISLSLWKNSHTLPGTADQLHISERTARRYRWQFILLVGHTYDFLTQEEYRAALKKETGRKQLDSH